MSDAKEARLVLLNYLVDRYASLKHSLTHLLGGNADLAGDMLHDTWVRISTKDDVGPVDNPRAYLTRMSVNLAVDIHRRGTRVMTGSEVEQLLENAEDTTPGPARLAEARSELAAVQAVMDRMPERRQRIAYLVHYEEMGHQEVAKLVGVSERTVAYELKRVHDAAASVLGRARK
jgi:RNA polymerase sigma factor (sigma-70 family)